MSRINETLKQKIDELDLDKRLNEAVDAAEVGVQRALELAGEFAHEHRDDYVRLVDRLTSTLHERTDGKYDEQVERVRDRLDQGIERLAERRTTD